MNSTFEKFKDFALTKEQIDKILVLEQMIQILQMLTGVLLHILMVVHPQVSLVAMVLPNNKSSQTGPKKLSLMSIVGHIDSRIKLLGK